MRQKKQYAALAVLVGLAALKLLAPEIGAGVRAGIGEALSAQPSAVTVFRDLSREISRHDTAADAQMVSVSTAEAAPAARMLQVVPSPTPAVTAKPTPSDNAVPEPTETPMPAAVTAFLERQAAFSDYALPEQVDYRYAELPFSYGTPVRGRNSSGFGYRQHPILNTVRFHYGTDFAAFSGERVEAFADGTVSFAGYDDSFGYHIRIDHGDGWQTLYAHCSTLYVSAGQQVAQGECIALVGATGLATGPHLHFELTHNGEYLNPEYYINCQ